MTRRSQFASIGILLMTWAWGGNPALAGSLDPTNPPAPSMVTLEDLYLKISGTPNPQPGGSLDPTNPPAPTMYTLLQLYDAIVQHTLSPDSAAVPGGFYAATNLVAVDPDLIAANIATNVILFGVSGSLRTNVYPIAVPRTGQTETIALGDDAWWSTNGVGVASPDPRFAVQSDTNIVLDTLTGLMWVRHVNLDADLDLGMKTWFDAIAYCNTLDYGGYDDWRLPNLREFLSLIDYGMGAPALPAGHPFTGFASMDPSTYHWTSTAISASPDHRWLIKVMSGEITFWNWAAKYYAWPVRGGQ